MISPGESNFIRDRFGRAWAPAALRGGAAFGAPTTAGTAFGATFGGAVFFEIALPAGACLAAALIGAAFFAALAGAAFFATFFGAALAGAAFFFAIFFGAALRVAFFAALRTGAFFFFAGAFLAGEGLAAFTPRFGAFPFAGRVPAAERFPDELFFEGREAFAFRAVAFFAPFFAAEEDFPLFSVRFLDGLLALEAAERFFRFFLEAAVALRPAFFPFAAGIKALRSRDENAM